MNSRWTDEWIQEIKKKDSIVESDFLDSDFYEIWTDLLPSM